jgi:hypothetical protein
MVRLDEVCKGLDFGYVLRHASPTWSVSPKVFE